ncbi:hypothetical protein FQN54_006319 [Arachnomyces sp. PD_36]|nr:hypothetical protein FQN54_006319 [Arachnomyces sp. PD_36]
MAETAAVGAPIQLPVINISEPNPTVGKAMIDAAAKYGFLYIDSEGCGIPVEDVDLAFDMSKRFFSAPREEKETCAIGPNNRGWTDMHKETLDPSNQRTGDFKEGMNFGEFKDGKAQQPLPKTLQPHEPDINRFTNLCRATCDKILTLLALGLDIPPTWFTTRHDPTTGPSGCTLRFLHYPSLSHPSSTTYQHGTDVRAGAHSDYGSITLLFQLPGQPGLEILTPENEWSPVPVWPESSSSSSPSSSNNRLSFPPILINIGDLLSYWTNGLLKSTVHRVIFPPEEQAQKKDRYSIAFFCHPVNSTELVPVPSELVAKRRVLDHVGPDPESRALTAKEHLAGRLAATYGFRKEEYQSET